MFARFAGWTERLRRSAFAFPLVVLVAGLLVAISELAYHESRDQLTRLVTMGQIRLEVHQVLRRVTEAESGQRGYLLTGIADHLLPYQDAARGVDESLGRLRTLFRSLGPDRGPAELDALEREIRAKLSEVDEVLSLRREGRNDAAQALLLSGIGREKMESIRRLADSLIAEENARVSRGLTNVFETLLLNRVGVAALAVISLIALGMFLHQSRVIDSQRAERQAQMAAEKERLEREVHARTAELTELASHLETAREDERARLARDLHDELGALLTAAKLDVARISPKLRDAAPEAMSRVSHLVELLNSGIALKRRIIEDLRPSTLSTLGLQPALEILCREFGERLGVPMQTHFEPLRLAPSAELTAFRMVQEALNNCAKYAAPTAVSVSLEAVGERQARLTVTDDGKGFDPSRTSSGRHGLIGMRYRIEAEGGQLSLRSAPGAGTTVSAVLPQAVAAAAAPLPDGPAIP
ncbi:CHASE3 domain-containing protein [Piscinibacter sakaiensis]|uniref:histidine kinase n=1 Tax=Piscinibacter sakaiensis TaxID=1547922 RepID=A0A0K8P365_PISS1|nr:CHASE3 domain-containing protein [Piscinibacter sakaiensis]GAP36620.1 sensor histidine kinase [Piscinibacter sakaiensis]